MDHETQLSKKVESFMNGAAIDLARLKKENDEIKAKLNDLTALYKADAKRLLDAAKENSVLKSENETLKIRVSAFERGPSCGHYHGDPFKNASSSDEELE